MAGLQSRHAVELSTEVERTWKLLDRMVEGVIVAAGDGRIRFANHAAAELFSFEAPADGRTILEATRHHEVAAVLSRLEREPEVLNHELRLEGLSQTRFLQVNALTLKSATGEREGALLVFHDLTRLRQLESVRQEFVANVSHELRTPLSLIKSAAETLIDGGKNNPAVMSRFLEIIDKHANRLTLLIDDLLLLSRLDSGRLDLRLQPVAMRTAVQEVFDDSAVLARARNVTLTNDVPAGIGANADPERLRQVIANLVDNAIKYGRADGHVTAGGREIGGGWIELTVRDDGPGIPPEASARVFERFYRVDRARSREQGGTGLGLSIVKNVVQAHGGDVRLESVPGKGAHFFIRLPRADAVAVARATA